MCSQCKQLAPRAMRSQYIFLAWLAAGSALIVPRQRLPRLATRSAVDEVPRGGAVPPLLRNKTPVEAVWTVAWPSVAIGLLRTALGQTDAWYIGRLGKKELEAMGAAFVAGTDPVCFVATDPERWVEQVRRSTLARLDEVQTVLDTLPKRDRPEPVWVLRRYDEVIARGRGRWPSV